MIINSYRYATSGVTATKLIFHTQPDGGVTGVDFTQQPVVRFVDASNVLDTSKTDNVTIAIYSGSGTLSGTATVAAVGGVATFTNLRITQSGGGHNVLKASATGMTDGRSGQMTIMPTAAAAKTVLAIGANTTDKVDCGSHSSMDNLSAGTFTAVVRLKRTATGNNQFYLSKYSGGGPGWAMNLDDGLATGDIAVTVNRAGGAAFAVTGAAGGRVAVGTWADTAFTWDIGDSQAIRIYKADVGNLLAEVSGYGTGTSNGAGAVTDDSASSFWIGNLEVAPTNPVKADIEWVAIFSAKLSLANMYMVQLAFDRNDTAMLAAISGFVDAWQCNNSTTVTSYSGNNNGTVTGATTTTGETVYAPSVWANSIDAAASSDKKYLQTNSHAEVTYTTTATTIVPGVYRLLSSYDAQNVVTAFEGTTYKTQYVAPTADRHSYGSLSLTAGSKTLRLVNSCNSRVGSAGTGTDGVGTMLLSLRANAALTQVVPSTPSTHYLFVSDSITDGFVCDTLGEHSPLNQLRNYLYNGGSRVSTLGYGGHTLYKIANDATARTNFVNDVKKVNPSHLIIELGLNDYINNLWSPASFETALGTLLSDLNTEFPFLTIYLVTCPTLATGEGANGGGNTVAQFRTAQTNAASGKSYVTVRTGTTGWFNGTNLGDTIHPNNDGGDEIYANAKTMLGV